MVVHFICPPLFKFVAEKRYSDSCLIAVGRCLRPFFFSCTQYPKEYVRRFLDLFSSIKYPLFTVTYACCRRDDDPCVVQVFQITTKK
jgi:hypothetical protein